MFQDIYIWLKHTLVYQASTQGVITIHLYNYYLDYLIHMVLFILYQEEYPKIRTLHVDQSTAFQCLCINNIQIVH